MSFVLRIVPEFLGTVHGRTRGRSLTPYGAPRLRGRENNKI